jgi:hypothetical protein
VISQRARVLLTNSEYIDPYTTLSDTLKPKERFLVVHRLFHSTRLQSLKWYIKDLEKIRQKHKLFVIKTRVPPPGVWSLRSSIHHESGGLDGRIDRAVKKRFNEHLYIVTKHSLTADILQEVETAEETLRNQILTIKTALGLDPATFRALYGTEIRVGLDKPISWSEVFTDLDS